ncbi:SDR family oxidoreductase [Salinarimonas sp.]|uniref:SDR family oxidoreductase n=1 Tax=Salinarimonas sp. TaxID=2766526 RepID=UPI0032D9473A
MSAAPFAGKRIVITGAGRDFGRTLAIMFAAEGGAVELSARDRDAAEAVAMTIRDRGGRARAHACDVSDPESVSAFAEAVAGDGSGVDVLVLNAARWLEGELDEVDDADIADTVSSSLTGAMILTKRLLPALRRAGQADILAMVSVCGEPGYLRSNAHPAFYAAKHGVAGFCDVLGARLAPEGIRVTGLFPPDFDNVEPLSPDWYAPRAPGSLLGEPAIWNAVRFALTQPRDGGVRRIHFEGQTRAELGL